MFALVTGVQTFALPIFAWPILDAERFSDLSFDLLVQAGMKMGLTQKRARDRLVAMQADILNVAKALLEATESEDAQLRSEERRAGKEGVRTGQSRASVSQ